MQLLQCIIIIHGADQSSAQQASTQLQNEILTAMDDPRFQVAVRETLRDIVERTR
jgi:transcriptional regulatory protein LevR